MKSSKNKEVWLNHVSLWKKSGLSINKYCKGNELKSSTFHYWIRKERSDKSSKPLSTRRFVKVDLPELNPTVKAQNFTLEYGTFKIGIPSEFNRQDLSKLLEVLDGRIKCS